MSERVRALVLTGFGINCEEETAVAFRLAGADARVVHLNDLLRERASLHDAQILALPGGFSFGDDLGSGRVLANRLLSARLTSGRRLLDELERFLADGKHVIGICNGFQVLVKAGLLPGLAGAGQQQVTLTRNDSGRFEDRWVRCRVAPDRRTPFLRELDLLSLPVRHGEGKLVVRDEAVLEAIVEGGLCCLTYADADGRPTSSYPDNPNGSALACAGLTDKTGQIFGLMPHPEAFLSLYNHPAWGRIQREDPDVSEDGDGLRIFRSAVRAIASGVSSDRADRGST